MIANEDFAAIAALELDSIKTKLMHKKSGKGWSLERASAVEREYRRFLYLMKKFPNEPTAPLVDVDTFWHYHILDTMKYAADCQHVFGYFLHHFPYVGMRGKEDEEALERLGERMRAIYEETFGEDYLAGCATGESKLALSAGTNAAAAYGAPGRTAGRTDPAHCTRALTEAAYCMKAVGGPAYCMQPAAEAAYCMKPVLEAAYCMSQAGEPAYCMSQAAEPAYCMKAAVEAAYCMVTSGEPNDRRAAGTAVLERNASGERSPMHAGLPEQRAAFYVERPALPVA